MEEHEVVMPDEHEDDGCPLCAMMGIEQVILIEELEKRGVHLARPEDISPDRLPELIATIGRELAKLRVFLEFTDHLSDEELYRRLYQEELREWSWVSPDDPMGATHIDFVGSGSDEDHLAWLTYYADDDDRADELEWHPGARLPERREPPFDRSSILPRATYGDELMEA